MKILELTHHNGGKVAIVLDNYLGIEKANPGAVLIPTGTSDLLYVLESYDAILNAIIMTKPDSPVITVSKES